MKNTEYNREAIVQFNNFKDDFHVLSGGLTCLLGLLSGCDESDIPTTQLWKLLALVTNQSEQLENRLKAIDFS